MSSQKKVIGIKYRGGIYIPSEYIGEKNNGEAVSAISGVLKLLGYKMSKNLRKTLGRTNDDGLNSALNEIVWAIKELSGSDVKHVSMYPNFPLCVKNMSEDILIGNALLHYETNGKFLPEYKTTIEREKMEIDIKSLKEIDILSKEEFLSIFTDIASSNESISELDKMTLKFFIENAHEEDYDLPYPENIPFKENLVFIASLLKSMGGKISTVLKTATDILRLLVHESGGDISLADKNVRFRSLPRHERRAYVEALEKVKTLEDFKRHKGMWIRGLHSLHVGDHSKKLHEFVRPLRENEKIETFNSKIESFIKTKSLASVLRLIKRRPGVFARSLDRLLRTFESEECVENILKSFDEVSENISTRVLLQLRGHFKVRSSKEDLIIFPKGGVQKTFIINGDYRCALPVEVIRRVTSIIDDTLKFKFRSSPALGKVYIEKAMEYCPLPSQQRSASNAIKNYARGTKIPFPGEQNILRLFVYWVGKDIDLSATIHGEDLNILSHVSYTNLRNHAFKIYHSGDIVDAPNGASEFIDIDIEHAKNEGARYIAMNIFVYNGPSFKEHKKVYAGWMYREKGNSGEIYEPATVDNKFDLIGEARQSIPVIFDLVAKEIIIVDLYNTNPRLKSSTLAQFRGGENNVETKKASITEIMKSIINMKNKTSLSELFTLHGEARGNIVEERSEADIVFAFDGDISPSDISKINSEFLT